MAAMPAMRYRTIKKPRAVSNITPEEAVELARIVAARRIGKSIGQLNSKRIAASTFTHSPKTSSGAVGKSKRSTSKSKSTRKSVARKR